MIVDSEKLLYPQYDLVKDVEEFLEKSKKEVGKIAKKRMEEEKPYHPEVRARWEALMQYCDEE